jgi:hypothetical protein
LVVVKKISVAIVQNSGFQPFLATGALKCKKTFGGTLISGEKKLKGLKRALFTNFNQNYPKENKSKDLTNFTSHLEVHGTAVEKHCSKRIHY